MSGREDKEILGKMSLREETKWKTEAVKVAININKYEKYETNPRTVKK